jgi:hypothetical protein
MAVRSAWPDRAREIGILVVFLNLALFTEYLIKKGWRVRYLGR